MLINTKFFDEVEVMEEDIIYFEDGLLGFEDLKRYVLIDIEGNNSLKCLQSADRQEIAFMVINPWDAVEDYKVDIEDSALETLGDRDVNNLLVYCLITITTQMMTANLIGPVIINMKTHKGKQIVMHKSNYTTKHIIKRFAESE